MDPKFAQLTAAQIAFCVSFDANRMVLSFDDVDTIHDVFGINGLTNADIVVIRNSVVKLMSAIMSEARKRSNWELFDKINSNMSAITMALDMGMSYYVKG